MILRSGALAWIICNGVRSACCLAHFGICSHRLVQHQHRLVESYTHFIQHGLVLEQQLLYGEASGKMQCFLMNMECITSFTDNCSPANLTTGFIKEHVFWNKLESIWFWIWDLTSLAWSGSILLDCLTAWQGCQRFLVVEGTERPLTTRAWQIGSPRVQATAVCSRVALPMPWGSKLGLPIGQIKNCDVCDVMCVCVCF